jgi:hypothetical protein
MSVYWQEFIRYIDLEHVLCKVLDLVLTIRIHIFYPPQVLCRIQTLVIAKINQHPRDACYGILRESNNWLLMLS